MRIKFKLRSEIIIKLKGSKKIVLYFGIVLDIRYTDKNIYNSDIFSADLAFFMWIDISVSIRFA